MPERRLFIRIIPPNLDILDEILNILQWPQLCLHLPILCATQTWGRSCETHTVSFVPHWSGMNMVLMSLGGLARPESPRAGSREARLSSCPHIVRRQHLRKCTCWGPGQSPNYCVFPSPTFHSRTWRVLREERWLKRCNELMNCSAPSVCPLKGHKRILGVCKSPLNCPGWSAFIQWGKGVRHHRSRSL